jgi:outer membrane protein, heavy metal efflux system
MKLKSPILFLAGPAAAALLASCTSVPSDLGQRDVSDLATERGLEPSSLSPMDGEAAKAALLSGPLTLESAVRIALTHNPDLRDRYAALGLAAADVYEAGRVRNPVLSASALSSDAAGDGTKTAFGLVGSFVDMITLPARSRYAKTEFEAVKQDLAGAVLDTSANASAAYFAYAGARQTLALRERIAKAATLSADLAQRFNDAGNITPRELAVEQAAASEARLTALEAAAALAEARNRLGAILGVSTGEAWDIPAQLQALPEFETDLPEYINLARVNRLDVSAARLRAGAIADRAGVTDWSSWLGPLDVGVEFERETDGTKLTGGGIEWEIPIFSQNRDQRMRANAELERAVIEVARATLASDNDVRLAYTAMTNARARAEEYRDRLIPARVAASQRAQEEQNYMLIGVFEVVSIREQEFDAYQGYLEAIRDYWLARTELSRATGTAMPLSEPSDGDVLDVENFTRPAPAMSMDHGHHGGHDMSGMDGLEGVDASNHDMTGLEEMESIEPLAHDMMDMPGMDHSGHEQDSTTDTPEERETP